jgi:hypothetical protein
VLVAAMRGWRRVLRREQHALAPLPARRSLIWEVGVAAAHEEAEVAQSAILTAFAVAALFARAASSP